MIRLAAILALAGCSAVEDVGGGAGINLTWLDGLGLPFGEVFQCENYVDPPLELCWKTSDSDALASMLDEVRPGSWSCEATPRHSGPCIYSCSPGHSGCNATSGCFCE